MTEVYKGEDDETPAGRSWETAGPGAPAGPGDNPAGRSRETAGSEVLAGSEAPSGPGDNPAGDRVASEGGLGDSSGNRSVARAVLVLDALADAPGDMELGVTELSGATGLAKSVISRILQPLVAAGLVERNPRTRRYRIGVRTFELGLRYLRRPGAREAALALLGALARETGATAYLGVLDGAHCVVLAAIEGGDRLRVVVTAGERTPVQATAMGKAILAALDEEDFRSLLDGGLPTPGADWRTLSEAALRRDIADTRARGYAIAQDDGYPGVWSVGAALPVHGETPMSVSVDVPAFSATEEGLHKLGQLLVERTRRFAEAALAGMLT